jgi:hypothetical protein
MGVEWGYSSTFDHFKDHPTNHNWKGNHPKLYPRYIWDNQLRGLITRFSQPLKKGIIFQGTNHKKKKQTTKHNVDMGRSTQTDTIRFHGDPSYKKSEAERASSLPPQI